MPEEYEAYGMTWLQHHPSWRMVTWDEVNLPPLRNQEQFDAARLWAQKSDIARYEILHRCGGVYIDTDFECLRNIEELLLDVDVFAATEDGRWVSTGIIGAAPRHRFLAEMIDAIPESIATQPGAPPNEVTGPKFFTRKMNEFCLANELITVFPSELFYPYHFSEPERRGETFPAAYAVHHWGSSWSRASSSTTPPPPGAGIG